MTGPSPISRLESEILRDGPTAARLYELGGLKLAQADFAGALTAYRQCLSLTPPNAALYNNMGTALIGARRYQEAVSVLESALVLAPAYERALVNLGRALYEAGRAAESVERLRRALVLKPDYVPALVNLGNALTATGQFAQAQTALERAIDLAPALPEAGIGLSNTLLRSGRPKDALEILQGVVARSPSHAQSRWHLGHLLFLLGHWMEAWPHMEFRLEHLGVSPAAGMQRWDGVIDNDLELYLVAEQGLGDQMQFARYARCLSQLGMRCIIRCEPRLAKLLEEAELGCRVEPQTMARPEHDPAARWTPLLSLPAWHRTQPDTVPCPQGYLKADGNRGALWESRLPGRPDLRVGLVWAGNPQFEVGRSVGRSPGLAAMTPLLGVGGINFVALQKGHGEEQFTDDPQYACITKLPDLDAGPDAFLDTAAVLKCIDLLITSDTAIAHLAGALGVPTWLCLTHVPDWRWGLHGDHTPWYATVRLFRQPRFGAWAPVFDQVAAELAAWRSSHQAC
jgi:tetratricopeptide (TPR) repeat protein